MTTTVKTILIVISLAVIGLIVNWYLVMLMGRARLEGRCGYEVNHVKEDYIESACDRCDWKLTYVGKSGSRGYSYECNLDLSYGPIRYYRSLVVSKLRLAR